MISSSDSSSSNSGSSGLDCSVTIQSEGLTVSFCFPVDFHRLVVEGCKVDASRGKVPLLACELVESDAILK